MALPSLLSSVLSSPDACPERDGDARGLQDVHLLSGAELRRGIQRYRRAIAAIEGPVTFSGLPPEKSERLLQQLQRGLTVFERELARRGVSGTDER